MRILLLSANTGEGHNSTSKAIMEVLEPQGITCDLRDTLAYLSPRFSKFVCNWHVRLYKYAPKLFDVSYGALERSGSDPSESTPVYELLSFGANKLWQTLMAGNYDAVICVHPFAGMMMTEVRRVWGLNIPCFFVATDYTCSPTVEQCDLDGYFIPAAELAGEFLRAGLVENRLIPTGIPVRQAFYEAPAPAEARSRLCLPAQGCVVLLMCGSMGCGPIRKIARELSEQLPQDAVVVAVCGNNEKLYESLLDLQSARLRVLGFTKDIPGYMDAADIIVTKPGGLSSTEAANKHLPTVLINAVGGCESRNFEFFLARGYAVGSDEAEDVVAQTIQLVSDEALRSRMRRELEKHFTVNSARKIADHVLAEAAAYREQKIASLGIDPVRYGNPTPEKGGNHMDNQQKQTVINLARSFAGESQARTRYTIYAQVARKEGYEWIARIFEQTAANEAVHAEEFLEHLQKLGACAPNIDLAAGYPFELGSTAENLASAAAGELQEHDDAYPGFAEIARREGFDDSARLWLQISRIEGVHHNTFLQLHEQLVSGTLTEKEAPITWHCLNCGYTYEGIRACDPCPVCGKEAGWQEGQLDTKKLIAKDKR